MLRATTACNFSSLIWPDGSTPAALASLLFDPPEPQIIGKNTVFCDFPTFSRTCIFFLLTLSLLWSSLFCSSLLWLFPALLFHLSILSEVWLLNFLRSIYGRYPSLMGNTYIRNGLFYDDLRIWLVLRWNSKCNLQIAISGRSYAFSHAMWVEVASEAPHQLRHSRLRQMYGTFIILDTTTSLTSCRRALPIYIY